MSPLQRLYFLHSQKIWLRLAGHLQALSRQSSFIRRRPDPAGSHGPLRYKEIRRGKQGTGLFVRLGEFANLATNRATGCHSLHPLQIFPKGAYPMADLLSKTNLFKVRTPVIPQIIQTGRGQSPLKVFAKTLKIVEEEITSISQTCFEDVYNITRQYMLHFHFWCPYSLLCNIKSHIT